MVYATNQQQQCHLVEFTLAGDIYKPLTVDPDLLISTGTEAEDKLIERSAADMDNRQIYVTPGEIRINLLTLIYLMFSYFKVCIGELKTLRALHAYYKQHYSRP